MEIYILLLLLVQDFVWAVDLTVKGPHYVRNGDAIWINCSADVVPSGKQTEFLVGGVTLDTLEKIENGCFSALKRAKCFSNVCHCSEDGKTYGRKLNVNQKGHQLNVACSMNFKLTHSISMKKEFIIRVLDLKDPSIIIDGRNPLIAGTLVKLKCIATTPLTCQIYWNCHNVTSFPPVRSTSTVTVAATLQLKSVYDGRMCICIVQYDTFITSASVLLNISSPPLITMKDEACCNDTSSITLVCALSGELDNYGFKPWIHKMNGIYIRKMSGLIYGNRSILVIRSCSYEDSGEYTCSAWNAIMNIKYSSRKTTTLSINSVPVIAETKQLTENGFQFDILYYSKLSPVTAQWFRYEEELENTATFLFNTTNVSFVNIPVYGRMVTCHGYYSSLKATKPVYGKYTVVLENKVGKIKHSFRLESELTKFTFQNVLWGLIAVIIIIAATGAIAVFVKIKNSQGNDYFKPNENSTNGRAIYYAAPGDESYVHIYSDPDHRYFTMAPTLSNDQIEEIPEHYEDILVHYEEIPEHYEEI